MLGLPVNFHVLKACNASCQYCFARFPETRGRLSKADAIEVMRRVREAGAEKMNFVGGEPTLHRDIGDLILAAKELGFVTGIVSNGAKLEALLDSRAGSMLDWVGLSIDSSTDEGNALIGRGGAGYVAQVVTCARKARSNGALVKLNTVVTCHNVHEDMSEIVRSIAPQRWKLFQVLRVEGQNEATVDDLLIDASAFRAFVVRHQGRLGQAVNVVPEDNHAMTDSYAMIDPEGRFFGNTGGVHCVGESILDRGAVGALASVGFSTDKLVRRGGKFDWERPDRRHLPVL